MALNKRKDQVYSGQNVTDITGSSGSLNSLGDAANDYVLFGIDTASGNLYYSNNGDTRQVANCLTLYHDVDTDGAAVGTVNLRGGTLPNNAIVCNAWYEVTTTYTDGADDSATIALGIETDDATGIEGATAISGGSNIWDAGVHGTDLDPSTASTFTTKTTAAGRNIIMTIADDDPTAGALVLHLDFRVSEIDTSS